MRKRVYQVLLFFLSTLSLLRVLLWATTKDGGSSPFGPPNTKIVFLKTHKTGGSTLQNILLRYGYAHDLIFALPPNGWMYPLETPFVAQMAKGSSQPWAKYFPFDVFAFHSAWNAVEVKKLIENPTFITILRDPVDTFESNYVYMGMGDRYEGSNINEFALKYLEMENTRPNGSFSGRNQLFWDLGYPNLRDFKAVREAILQLDELFDQVLILEKFDASLLLLKEKLSWNLNDFLYLKHNERVNKSLMTPGTRSILRDWLKYDYLLYEHFSRKVDLQVKDYGIKKMNMDLLLLKEGNKEIYEKCVNSKSHWPWLRKELKPESDLVYSYSISDAPHCPKYAWTESTFVQMIRTKQLAKTFFHIHSNNLFNESLFQEQL